MPMGGRYATFVPVTVLGHARQVLQCIEEGTDQATSLSSTDGLGVRCVRLHRDVLLPHSPA